MDSFEHLDDVQLAILLSFIANEHCILTFEGDPSSLQDGIESFVRTNLGLHIVTVNMAEQYTLDDLANQIILEERAATSPRSYPEESYFSRRGESSMCLTVPRLPNVILLKYLNVSSAQQQAQVIELMKSRKLVTRKAVIPAPKRFLVIPLIAKTYQKPELINSLLDGFFISHDCGRDYGSDEQSSHDTDSLSSVIVRRPTPNALSPSSISSPGSLNILFSDEDIDRLSEAAEKTFFHIEVKKFIADVVTFLRLHRTVAGGITPQATKHFELLVRCLAPLHNMDYVTPTLAQLAAPKIYSHRIEIVKPEDERTLQWGSTETAIRELLAGISAEAVIQDVLEEVKPPR